MILRTVTSRRRQWHLAERDLDIVRNIEVTLSTDSGETIGVSSLSLLRLLDCERIEASAWDVLDEHSIELADYVALVDDYDWAPATLEWLDAASAILPDHLLIVRNTKLIQGWRGQGLAVPFAAASLLAAARGRHCLAVMIPAPPLNDDGPDFGTDEHDAEVARLTRRWSPLGYQPMAVLGDRGPFTIHGLVVNAAADHLRSLVRSDERIRGASPRSSARSSS